MPPRIVPFRRRLPPPGQPAQVRQIQAQAVRVQPRGNRGAAQRQNAQVAIAMPHINPQRLAGPGRLVAYTQQVLARAYNRLGGQNVERLYDRIVRWGTQTRMGQVVTATTALLVVTSVSAYVSNRVIPPLAGGNDAGQGGGNMTIADNVMFAAAESVEKEEKETTTEMTDSELEALLPAFKDALLSFDLETPPDLTISDVREILTNAKRWAEMGEHDFWVEHRPKDFEERGLQSVESIGNQIALVNFQLNLTLPSDVLNPVEIVWKSEEDETTLVEKLKSTYKDQGPTAMYDYIANYRYEGGRLPRATSCTAVIDALEALYEEKGGIEAVSSD